MFTINAKLIKFLLFYYFLQRLKFNTPSILGDQTLFKINLANIRETQKPKKSPSKQPIIETISPPNIHPITAPNIKKLGEQGMTQQHLIKLMYQEYLPLQLDQF